MDTSIIVSAAAASIAAAHSLARFHCLIVRDGLVVADGPRPATVERSLSDAERLAIAYAADAAYILPA